MKSWISGIVLAAMGLVGSASWAASIPPAESYVGSVTLYYGSQYGSNGMGGEFAAVINGAPAGIIANQNLPGVNSGAHNMAGGYAYFQTFCIQGGDYDRVFYPNDVSYAAYITKDPLCPPPDKLVAGVTYLYDQFWKGTLDGYDYTGSHRNADAGALQATIWMLLGEFGSAGSIENQWAVAASWAGISNPNTATHNTTGSNGNGSSTEDSSAKALRWYAEAQGKDYVSNVKVLTLFKDGTYYQSQLVEVAPVPLPAATGVGFSMLAGFGGLCGLRKRLGRRQNIA